MIRTVFFSSSTSKGRWNAINNICLKGLIKQEQAVHFRAKKTRNKFICPRDSFVQDCSLVMFIISENSLFLSKRPNVC